MKKYINPHGIRKRSIIISLIHNKAILYKTEKNKILCFIQNQITRTYRGSEQLPILLNNYFIHKTHTFNVLIRCQTF